MEDELEERGGLFGSMSRLDALEVTSTVGQGGGRGGSRRIIPFNDEALSVFDYSSRSRVRRITPRRVRYQI